MNGWRRWIILVVSVVALLLLLAPSASAIKYGKAKRAAQARANQVAGQPTRISSLYCFDFLKYCSATGEWTRTNPTGCRGCGYNPITGQFTDTPTTEYCSVNLEVRQRRSGRLVTRVTGTSCY